jgi:hypothetical protein
VSTGQVIAVARDACRVAFQSGSVRLVEAMLRCVTGADLLGWRVPFHSTASILERP